MIYLFDDRQGRRERHAKSLNRFPKIIKAEILKLNSEGNLDESIIENYGEAKLIILHSSYLIKGGEIKSEEIRDYFLKKGLDVVTFSGATDNSSISNQEGGTLYNINAERMYENLELFLKDYELNDDPNLELLMWGSQYRLNQLLTFQCKLGSLFINDKLNEPISNHDADDLISLTYDTLPSESLVDFKKHVVKYIETGMQHSLTPYQLINYVSNLLINYKK